MRNLPIAKGSKSEFSRKLESWVHKFYANKAVKDLAAIQPAQTNLFVVHENKLLLRGGLWRVQLFVSISWFMLGMGFAAAVTIATGGFAAGITMLLISVASYVVSQTFKNNFPLHSENHAMAETEIELQVQEQVLAWGEVNNVDIPFHVAYEVACRSLTDGQEQLETRDGKPVVLVAQEILHGSFAYVLVEPVSS